MKVIPITRSKKNNNAVKILGRILEAEWPKIEPYFIEEFEALMIRKIAFGIEPTQEDYNDACARVIKKSGIRG